MANIKKVRVGSTDVDIEALHFITGSLDTPAQWKEYIDNAVAIGLVVEVVTELPTASASTMGKIYLIAQSGGKTSDAYDEYLTVDKGSGTPRYVWEKIGDTRIDLSGYVEDGTYTTQSVEGHAHSVTVPTVSKTTTKLKATSGNVVTGSGATKNALGENATFTPSLTLTTTKLKATHSGTTVGADGTATVLTGVSGTSSNLVTTSITPAVSNGTASKATAGTAKDVAKAGTAVSVPNVTNAADVSATYIASPSVVSIGSASAGTSKDVVTGYPSFSGGALSGTKTFVTGYSSFSGGAFSASVDSNGVLSFAFTAASLGTASTGTVGYTAASLGTPSTVSMAPITVTTVNGVVKSTASTPSVSDKTASKVTLGDAISITPAVANGTITPYTFADVTVAKAGTAVTAATGALASDGSGASVLTAVSGNGTATALTGVKVTSQGAVAIASGASGDVTVATGAITSHTVTVNTKDAVAAITSLATGAPTITLSSGATGDVTVVDSVTIGSTSADTTSAGGHSHDITLS